MMRNLHRVVVEWVARARQIAQLVPQIHPVIARVPHLPFYAQYTPYKIVLRVMIYLRQSLFILLWDYFL